MKVAVLAAFLAFAGCDDPGGGVVEKTPPPPTVVTPDRQGLMFRYPDGRGGLLPAATAEEVPAEARARVVVVDAKLSPAERGAAHWVHVVDLTKLGEDGRYPVRVVPRAGFEASLRAKAETGAPRVTMYGTSWCGVCTKARAFLKAKGISYVEKDIEKDPGAAAELQRKAGKAGVKATGVPVFDVGGAILPGFDKAKLEALLRQG